MSLYKSFGSSDPSFTRVAGEANIDEMNFAFIDMGQGDCTIISCPDNTVYIVDCGSSGGLEEKSFTAAKKLVRDWSKGNGVHVILTHPDKDHYNKIIELLGASPKVEAGVMFFSRARSNTSPLGYYKQTALGRNLPILGTLLLIEVTLNRTQHKTKKWMKITDFNSPIEEDIPETGYVIRNGTTSKGTAWSLTIIAGNVQTASKVDSEKSNVVSLVTVVKLGKEKLVLTGDATADTLSYIFDKQDTHIEDVSMFQVPHHGSGSSYPTLDFRNWVDPQSLVVSVGLLVDSYNLPRYNVISRWKKASRLRTVNYTIDYWKTLDELPDGSLYDNTSKLQNILDTTWKPYTVLNNGRSFFWLADPNNAGPSGTGFYGFTHDGFFIYREAIDKDIYMTGIVGSGEIGFK